MFYFRNSDIWAKIKIQLDTAALKKACNYCVYQERTHDEVRKKLREWKVFGDEAEEIIAWLIIENFINEERFAKAYAGGKFRVKNWGKLKIIAELKARKISKYNLESAISEISDNDYLLTVKSLIVKKESENKGELNFLKKKQKIYNYLTSKGFESSVILEEMKTLGI